MTDFELTKCCALFEFGCSNAAAKAVLVALAARSRNGCVDGYTSDSLARTCCVQRVAFLKAVSWLEERGLIFVKRHSGVKSQFTFNEALIASGSLVGIESDTELRNRQSKVSIESVTESVSNPLPSQYRIRNSVSSESVTVYKKEKEKKEKGDSFEFPSLSSTANDKPVDCNAAPELKASVSLPQEQAVLKNIAENELKPARRRTWAEFVSEQCGI